MATNENSNQSNQSNANNKPETNNKPNPNNRNRNNRNRNNSNNKPNNGNQPNNTVNKVNNNPNQNSNPNAKKKPNRNWRRKPRRKKTNENNKENNPKSTSSDLLPPKKGENKKKVNHNKIVNVGRALNDITKQLQNDIKDIKDNTKICVVCSKEIEDMLTAIKIGDDLYCHFQCAQNKILEKEELKSNETLTYIGNGDFSVIQKRNNRGKNYLFMRKRITRDEQEF